jgi:hypothetical protein
MRLNAAARSASSVPRDASEPPSTASNRHQQQPANTKLAQAFNAASNPRDTLVVRRSLDGDEHLGPAILASASPPCAV